MTTERKNYLQVSVVFLAVLAACFTLHVARDILLPLTLACIFALLLAPLVTRLASLNIHRGFSAALVIACLVGGVGSAAFLLAGPALQWLGKTPEALVNIQSYFETTSDDLSSVEAATETLQTLEEMTESEGAGPVTRVEVVQPGLATEVWSSVRNFFVYGLLSVVVLFFLLSAGDLLLDRFMQTLTEDENRARFRSILSAAQQQMSRYLITITCLNLLVGVLTACGLWLLGYPDPALWGVMVLLLRYLPYVGVSLAVLMFVVIGGVSFDPGWKMFAAPVGYVGLSVVVGQLVEPFVHGLRFRLNPIVVCVWIFFWGWIWGAPGLLMAVPLLTLFQVICQHFSGLQRLAHVIGSSP